jgi:predicted GIY-YIG superfamily endonuclease
MSDTIDQINSVIVNITNTRNQLNYMKKVLTVAPDNKEILSETQTELRRIRKFYDTTSSAASFFPFGTEYIYVWELEEGKYYIGYSENLSGRLEQHTSGSGALWTKKYKPVSIIEIVRGGKDIEKSKTLEYMKLKGFDNVRGAAWCKIDYTSIPPMIQEYLSSQSSEKKNELYGTLLANILDQPKDS